MQFPNISDHRRAATTVICAVDLVLMYNTIDRRFHKPHIVDATALNIHVLNWAHSQAHRHGWSSSVFIDDHLVLHSNTLHAGEAPVRSGVDGLPTD